MSGWIKLHRKILDNPIVMKDSDHLAIWAYLLLSATHAGYPALFKGQKIILQPGQLITGSRSIGEKLCVNESKVRRVLNALISDGQIDKQTSNKNSLITILNWDLYQSNDGQNASRVTDKRRTSDGQVTTNKNERMKECKNVINYQEIICMYETICVSYPRIKTLSDARKKAISARLKIYSVDDFRKLFEMAEQSKFLKGANDRNWSATFDWLIKDSNMAKVLDGNYADKEEPKEPKGKFDNFELPPGFLAGGCD